MQQKTEAFESPITSLLSDFNTKLRDMEEKQRLIKDRVLLIGENLIAWREDSSKELAEIKSKLNILEREMEKIKEAVTNIIEENSNFARKAELQILERQFKIFQPILKK